jgi:hypothetical protein
MYTYCSPRRDAADSIFSADSDPSCTIDHDTSKRGLVGDKAILVTPKTPCVLASVA